MNDDFSNFKSAIDWSEPREVASEADAGFKPLGHGLFQAIDNAAHAYAIAPDTDSPIEVQFGGYLAGNLSRALNANGIGFKVGPPEPATHLTVFLCPQYVVGRFRYDFALLVNNRPAVLIECDGKEFHSSDEAIANDRGKDQRAAEIGALIRRYTGSSIYRDLKGCVDDAIS